MPGIWWRVSTKNTKIKWAKEFKNVKNGRKYQSIIENFTKTKTDVAAKGDDLEDKVLASIGN